MKTIAIIQARLGSTRLPRKVLSDIDGQTMIEHVVQRVSRCRNIDEVVVATTRAPGDQELVQYCRRHNWSWFAGSEKDVLKRYVDTAKAYSADLIVRITSDCPLIDPDLIDQTIDIVNLNSKIDYACNFHPTRRLPRGLDCEVLTRETLDRLDQLAVEAKYREHVTLYAYRHSDQFSIGSVTCDDDWSHLRWTVDDAQDLQLVRAIYRYFRAAMFDWQDVIAAYDANPDWIHINKNSIQKAA